MARTAEHSNWELSAARTILSKAKNIQELRQSQAILLPALAGLTLKQTAELLGLSRDRVVVLRREFRRSKGVPILENRGGRRHQLLTTDEEASFLEPWLEKFNRGEVIAVRVLQDALEDRVGHPIPKSTVYRILARHGWKKRGTHVLHP